MSDKTISYLNTRWWYRLLKVIVIITFFLGSISTSILIYSDKKPENIIDNQMTTISCYGKIYTTNELDLFFYKYVDTNSINFAKKKCKEIEYQKNSYKYEGQPLPSKFGDKLAILQNPEMKVPDDQNFSINEGYKLTDGYLKVCLYIIIWWIILYIIFEIIKRSFYYIVLGTIKPKK